jgi:hypothetical protein
MLKFGVRGLALAFIGRALCGPDAFADRGLPRPLLLGVGAAERAKASRGITKRRAEVSQGVPITNDRGDKISYQFESIPNGGRVLILYLFSVLAVLLTNVLVSSTRALTPWSRADRFR